MTQTMLNTQRTFGVEIECLVPTRLTNNAIQEEFARQGIIIYHAGYTHNISRDWKMVTDASIYGPSEFRGLEFVSPILRGTDGLEQVIKVCAALNVLGAEVNKSCGLHVHHDAQDFTPENFDNICSIYKACEPELDKMMPRSRHNGTYCKALKNVSKEQWEASRYYKLNLCAFMRYGTLEFRQHSATTDATKILAWIHLTQAIMERAKGRKFRTTVKNREYLFDGLRLWKYNHADSSVQELMGTLRKHVAKRQKKMAS